MNLPITREPTNPLLKKVKNWISVVTWSVRVIIGGMTYLGSREIKWPKCRSWIVQVRNVVHETRDVKS
jgi:hypothetical protein